MMQRMIYKFIALLLTTALAAGCFVPCSAESIQNNTESTSETLVNDYVAGKDSVFNSFISHYYDAAYPNAEVDLISKETTVTEKNSFSKTVNVEKEGLYALEITYKVPSSSRLAPVASIAINGIIPYSEASRIKFFKTYMDTVPVEYKSSYLPSADEVEGYNTVLLSDTVGYYGGTLYFYLNKGENSVELTLLTGDISISKAVFLNADEPINYSEAKENFRSKEYKGESVVFEAETTLAKSDSSLIPSNDSSSKTVSPSDSKEEYINVIGGSNWQDPGQYIEWEFTVPEDGLYSISLKYRQNINLNMESYRRIYIDGAVPYKELEEYEFDYAPEFIYETLSANGEAMLFDLKAGEHTIRMEVVIGPLSEILPQINKISTELNFAYRKVIQITGTAPDTLRDYNFDTTIPEVLELLSEQKDILKNLCDRFIEIMEEETSGSQTMKELLVFLENVETDSYYLSQNLSSLRNYISSLSTLAVSLKEQPLVIDQFYVTEKNGDLQAEKQPFYKWIITRIKDFLYTFSSNYKYNQLNVESAEIINLWCGDITARFKIREQLIQEYAKEYNTEINVVMTTTSVVSAKLSGMGPDLMLGVSNEEVQNLAFRNALVDLTRFGDLNTVLERFYPSCVTSLKYKNKVYGLPEESGINMLYYRTDIFEELELEPPETWDDVVYVLTMLKKNNLEFGITFGLDTFTSMLYQRGGNYWNKDYTATDLCTDLAIECFTDSTAFFTDYSAPISASSFDRFRTGEMPIIFGGLAIGIQINIFAPELLGVYDMIPVPGTLKEDGTIDYTQVRDVTADIILNEEKADGCWQFLKWWTSTETQVAWSERCEAALDMTNRTSPANKEAMMSLAWDSKTLELLEFYEDKTTANPPVPGSYFFNRNMLNAYRAVVYKGDDPADALRKYTKLIDSEVERKIKYFRLDKE